MTPKGMELGYHAGSAVQATDACDVIEMSTYTETRTCGIAGVGSLSWTVKTVLTRRFPSHGFRFHGW